MNGLRYCTLLIGLSLVTGLRASTIFVDASATGNNNGQTWQHAYTNLQTALGAATGGDVIWVANGTYRPVPPRTNANDPPADRTVSFVIPKNVRVYGGFAGGETMESQRNELVNQAVLDGDIDLTTTDRGYNSYHVVWFEGLNLDTATKLSGFTIQNGNANATSDPHSKGGGIYLNGTYEQSEGSLGPALDRLLIRDNSAYAAGGGIYSLHYLQVYLANCTFRNNTVTSTGGQGGGLCYDGKGYGVLQNGLFFANTSGGVGGGASSSGDYLAAIFANCTFSGNTAAGASSRYGHAIYSLEYVELFNSIVWDNGSSGLQLDSPADPVSSYFTVRYSDVEDSGWPTGEGYENFSLDPRFRDAENGVLSVTGCSPCIDSGFPGTGTTYYLQIDNTDVDEDQASERMPWDVKNDERIVRYRAESATLDRGAPEECPGDVDGDGDIDISDLAFLLSHFGETGCVSGGCAKANFDCDEDDSIGLADLSFLLSHFGYVCSPGNNNDPPGSPVTGGVTTSVSVQDTSSYTGGGFYGESQHFVFDVLCTIAESADDWTGSGVTVTVANGATLRLVPNAGNPPTPGDSIPEKYTTFFGEPRAVNYSGRFTNPLPNGAIVGKYDTGTGAYTYTSTAINAAWYDMNASSNDGPAAVFRIVINVSGVNGADTSGGLGSVYFTTGSPGSGDIKVADMTFDVEHKYADTGSTVTVGSFYVTD